MKNLRAFDLSLLFKSLLQQKDVLNEHAKIAAKIIRPFYEILEQEDLLINRKLSAMFAKEKAVNLSQYVGWWFLFHNDVMVLYTLKWMF